MMELIHEADPVAPYRCTRRIRQRAGVTTIDENRAAIGPFQQSREVQQGRFSGA
jgi:hypothetical protein